MLFFLAALLVATVDQLSKVWVRSYGEGQVIFQAGFFRITSIHNTGAVFGLFQGQSFLLTIIAFIGVALILLFAFPLSRRLPLPNTAPDRLALGLILGGTVGNLVDRLRFGGVTDFISVGIWPTFNLADSAVTIGVVLLVSSLLFSDRLKKPFQPEAPD